MLVRSIPVLASFFLAALTSGCATVAPPASVGTAPVADAHVSRSHARTPEERRLYRFDFVVSSREAGKAPASSAFTLNLEEERGGEIGMGVNMPISPPSSSTVSRADVGLKLHCSFTPAGDALLLHDSVEMSAVDDLPTIRKLTANGDTFVEPGKPVLVASLEDASAHKRYEVMVTATKLH